MKTMKYMDEEVVIKKAMGVLIKELGPVEAVRFITIPKIKRIESVRHHREWQKISEYAAVIPKFITKALAGEPLVIYGDGLQTRDFVFVKDVVRANITAAESGETGVFNIGSGETVTINELAGVVIELCGKNLEMVHVEPRV